MGKDSIGSFNGLSCPENVHNSYETSWKHKDGKFLEPENCKQTRKKMRSSQNMLSWTKVGRDSFKCP